MAETILERPVCESCGADVREGTSFCYNCGKPVSADAVDAAPEVHTSNGSANVVSAEAQAALDDLSHRFRTDETGEENKLAQAARERKQARVRARRNQVVWEPADTEVSGLFVVFTLIIVVLTAVIVLLAVYWK